VKEIGRRRPRCVQRRNFGVICALGAVCSARWCAGGDGRSAASLLASGAASIATNSWHTLRLAMRGDSLRCYVDGTLVTNFTDSTYSSGMAGIGCGWHGAQFDNFTLRRLRRDDFNFALGATASASSFWQDDPTYAASMANDGTMGSFAADSFPAVTSSKVRLVLTNFTSSPSIYEFGVHDVAQTPATNLALAAAASASSVWSDFTAPCRRVAVMRTFSRKRDGIYCGALPGGRRIDKL
jgi:hypothetical protein